MPPWPLSQAWDLEIPSMWWGESSSWAGMTILGFFLGPLSSQLHHWLILDEIMAWIWAGNHQGSGGGMQGYSTEWFSEGLVGKIQITISGLMAWSATRHPDRDAVRPAGIRVRVRSATRHPNQPAGIRVRSAGIWVRVLSAIQHPDQPVGIHVRVWSAPWHPDYGLPQPR